ncbi:hypothetical protein [Nitrospirillum iridis]|uniref:Uncharacterized protein n=1 Tax=Nitrospirillum iridis TaxID=765888 RepID=A0A7X0EDW8_9PROT|nr:hypothetical protein [Nitrospirillum iridis]MBB6251431.1 hypothetical protein [Nitrospirillum iridis]
MSNDAEAPRFHAEYIGLIAQNQVHHFAIKHLIAKTLEHEPSSEKIRFLRDLAQEITEAADFAYRTRANLADPLDANALMLKEMRSRGGTLISVVAESLGIRLEE